jgi:transcriptional regulator of acetoin/glycerol metabolism
MDEDVLFTLKSYAWPGNVRELQNVLERMLIMSGERITMEDLPDELSLAARVAANPGQRSSLGVFRDNAEREFIVAALKRHHGNVTKAAADLGVGRTYLHRRLLVLGIGKKDVY